MKVKVLKKWIGIELNDKWKLEKLKRRGKDERLEKSKSEIGVMGIEKREIEV